MKRLVPIIIVAFVAFGVASPAYAQFDQLLKRNLQGLIPGQQQPPEEEAPAPGEAAEEAPVAAEAPPTAVEGAAPGAEGEGRAEYYQFWYSKQSDGTIKQEQLPGPEYEAKKADELYKWRTLYESYFMQGNYEAGVETHDIDPYAAQMMTQLSPEMYGEMSQSMERFNAGVDRLARWTLFYQQLGYYHQWVEESVLGEESETDEEKIQFVATEEKEHLDTMWQALRKHAEFISVEQQKHYFEMVEKIEENEGSNRAHENWLKVREQDMMQFADNWAKQYDGSEVEIDDTIYLVRNLSEKPDDPRKDEMKHTLPRDSVLIDTQKEKMLTPHDLLEEDGELKKPRGQ